MPGIQQLLYRIGNKPGTVRPNSAIQWEAGMLALGLFLLHQLIEWGIAVVYHHSVLDICHWDCLRYVALAEQGYPAAVTTSDHMENWAFFPLFPLLIRAGVALTASPAPLVAVLLGKLLFLGSIYAFILFARKYSNTLPALYPALIVTLSPYAVYGNSGYTEPLFLLLTSVFFLLLKDRRFLACGLVGMLLSASRAPGILATLPYALVALQSLRTANWEQRKEIVLGGLLIPLGLGLFMFHLYHRMGDALAFLHVQKAWGRNFGNPLTVIAAGIRQGTIHLDWALMSLTAVVAALLLIAMQDAALGVFSLVSLLIPLSSGLQSMPRYIWWQAPLLLLLAQAMKWRAARLALIPLFAAGMVYMYIAWMMGKSWTT
ncbi:mannosyltransferase family protein [Dyella choica]|nr:mannosyltransferase family protein [Dyella choica]